MQACLVVIMQDNTNFDAYSLEGHKCYNILHNLYCITAISISLYQLYIVTVISLRHCLHAADGRTDKHNHMGWYR